MEELWLKKNPKVLSLDILFLTNILSLGFDHNDSRKRLNLCTSAQSGNLYDIA